MKKISFSNWVIVWSISNFLLGSCILLNFKGNFLLLSRLSNPKLILRVLSGFFMLFVTIWDLYGCFLLLKLYFQCTNCSISSLSSPFTSYALLILSIFCVSIFGLISYILYKYLKKKGFFQGYTFTFIFKEQIILFLFHSLCFELQVRAIRAFIRFTHFFRVANANSNMSIAYSGFGWKFGQWHHFYRTLQA